MRPFRLSAAALLGGIVAALLTGATAQAPKPSAAAATPGAAPGAGRGFLLDKHMGAGLKCMACHSENPPAKQPDMAVCTKCHGSYAEIAAKTASDSPNPHASHMGELACTDCHHIHMASQSYCLTCHTNFHMTTP